jgi:hypothetical protein
VDTYCGAFMEYKVLKCIYALAPAKDYPVFHDESLRGIQKYDTPSVKVVVYTITILGLGGGVLVGLML